MTDKTTRPPKDNLVRAVFPGPEFRAELDDSADDGFIGHLTGHLAVWNTWTEINSSWEGNFLERVNPGAFDKAIQERAPKVTLNHGQDPQAGDKPLGPILSLGPDDIGMAYDVGLIDTSYNRDIKPGLEHGQYGSSFRFSVIKEEFNRSAKKSAHNPKGLPERTILEATLPEFGPVTFPAYIGATAGVRSMTDEYILSDSLGRFIEQPELLRALMEQRGIEQPERADALPDDGAASEHSDGGSRSEPLVEAKEHGRKIAEAFVEGLKSPPPVAAATPNQDPPERGSSAVKEQTVNTIEERVARIDEIGSRLAEIQAEHGVDVLPDAVQAEWDQLNDERETHEKAVTAFEERKAVLDRTAKRPQNTERVSAPAVISRQNIYDVERIRSESRTDAELQANLRDNAMRSVDSVTLPHPEADTSRSKEKIARLLDEDKKGTLAFHILATGNPTYRTAWSKLLAGKMLTADESRAIATVGSSQLADGGYAVPYVLDPALILTSNGQINPLRQMARVETLTGAGNTWKGVTTAGITVSRVAEEAPVTPTSPTLAQPSVTVQAVKAEIQYSIEADEDWPRLQAEMARLLQDAKDAEEAEQFINGNGDGTSGNPQGIVAGLDASSDVGTTGDGFDVEDVHRLINALPDRFEPRAQFLAHRAVYSAIAQFGNVANAGAGAVWQTMGQGRPPQLLGYPARYSSAMESDYTTEGNDIMLFGDFEAGFIIVDKVGLTVEIDPHVRNGDGRWTGQRALLAHYRNNSMVLVDNALRLLKVGVVTS